MWIDRGSIRSRQTASHAFQYGYQLNIVILDWADHTSILFIHILDWVRRHQPDLVASQSASGFTFEADIIDKTTIDLSIEIELTETVGAVRRIDGGWDMQHHAEPAPMFPDDDSLVPGTAPTLTEIWWQGERLLPLPE